MSPGWRGMRGNLHRAIHGWRALEWPRCWVILLFQFCPRPRQSASAEWLFL